MRRAKQNCRKCATAQSERRACLARKSNNKFIQTANTCRLSDFRESSQHARMHAWVLSCGVSTPAQSTSAFEYVKCVMDNGRMIYFSQLYIHHHGFAYPNDLRLRARTKGKHFDFALMARQSSGSIFCQFDSRTFTEDSSDGKCTGMMC